MKFKTSLISSAVVGTFGSLVVQSALAAPIPSCPTLFSTNTAIQTFCVWSGDTTIQDSVVVSGTNGGGILRKTSAGTEILTIGVGASIQNTQSEAIYIGLNGSQFNASLGQILNNGTLQGSTGPSSGWSSVYIGTLASLTTLTNTSTGVITGGNQAALYIDGGGAVTNINNSGAITGGPGGRGIYIANALGQIGTVQNSANATITGTGGAGIENNGSIASIVNFGSISGSTYGIKNSGTISALTNAQNNLRYQGALPTQYSVKIDSPTSYGKLVATSPTGTTTFGIATGSTVARGTYSSVITGLSSSNFSGLTGTFGTYKWTLSETSSVWDLVIANQMSVHDSTVAMVNTPAQNAAAVIDANPNLQNLFIGLSGDNAVSNAAKQTLPLLTGGGIVAAQSALSGINRVIQARIDTNRGMSSGDEFYGNKSFWMKPFGSSAEQSDRNGVSGFKANSYGLATGIDGTISPALRIGAALAYANSNINNNSTAAIQGSDVDVFQLIGYGSYSLDDRTELNFQADVGLNNNKGKRTIAFTSSVASSDYNSQTAHVGIGIGRSYPISSQTSLTPSIRTDYTWINDTAYAETGAGLLNLNVAERSTEALVVGLDGKLSHQLNDQTTLTANFGVGYDTNSKQSSVTAAFAGAPGTAFVTYGIDPSPWIAHAGGGAVYRANTGLEITGRYDAEQRDSFINQTASVKFRWSF